MAEHLNTGISSRLNILLDNYRESRQEGIQLAHSAFKDIALATALVGTIVGGGKVINEPQLLLLLPLFINGLGLYAIQKFRVNSLVTSYMIYLEEEINKEVRSPVMMWNTEFIIKNVSAGRESGWGEMVLIGALICLGAIYIGMCLWVTTQNQILFVTNKILLLFYWLVCLLLLAINLIVIVRTLSTIRKYTPKYIEQIMLDRQANLESDKVK